MLQFIKQIHDQLTTLNGFIKGAMKLYSSHFSCLVIVLFNTGLWKSLFSTDSFGKLVFYLSELFFVFCLFCVEYDGRSINLLALHNGSLHSNRCQVLPVFFLTYLKQFVKTDTHHKNLSIALNKNMPYESFWAFEF